MDITALADQIYEAHTSKTAIPPIRSAFGAKDIEAAYQIQEYNIDRQLKAGQQVVGKKIGLTSRKVQAQLGVDQPDFGILLDSMQIENGAVLPYTELLQPKAEAEVAFVLKRDLVSEYIEMEDIIQAIDYVVPAIEIVGSRIQNWDIQITDTIADNASSSHFVLGDNRVDLADIDLEACAMELRINGQVQSQGNGKACLGNPLNAVLWLAKKMQQLGQALLAEEVILSGALGPMVVIEPGDQVEAQIEGLGGVQFAVGK